MLAFVVVDEDGVNKLNFPRLTDEYKPLVQISPGLEHAERRVTRVP
jgi:hypothetical protein